MKKDIRKELKNKLVELFNMATVNDELKRIIDSKRIIVAAAQIDVIERLKPKKYSVNEYGVIADGVKVNILYPDTACGNLVYETEVVLDMFDILEKSDDGYEEFVETPLTSKNNAIISKIQNMSGVSVDAENLYDVKFTDTLENNFKLAKRIYDEISHIEDISEEQAKELRIAQIEEQLKEME